MVHSIVLTVVWILLLAAVPLLYHQAKRGNLFFCKWIVVPTLDKFEKLRDAAWSRYGSKHESEATDYLSGVVDRQINKVIGLLTLDAIFVVAVQAYIEHYRFSSWVELCGGISTACFWVAIVTSLRILVVEWSSGERKYFLDEFYTSAKLIRKRTILIHILVGLNGLGIFFVALPAAIDLITRDLGGQGFISTPDLSGELSVSIDLTGLSCTRRFDRNCLGKEPGYAEEEVQCGADCGAATPD